MPNRHQLICKQSAVSSVAALWSIQTSRSLFSLKNAVLIHSG